MRNKNEIEEIRQEMVTAGLIREIGKKKKTALQKSQPLHLKLRADVDLYIGKNNKIVEGYRVWHDIMRRCYSEHSKDRFQAYYHICTVSEEWHNYQNFAKWFNDNKYEVNERLHIDKDILCPGNKKYCEEMCMLVPQRINMLFANKPNKRGLPNGIVQYKHGFLVKYAGEEYGIKETLDEAFELYADKKKEAIINIANEYKSVIPNKLYEALLSYEGRIDVDRNYVA